MRKKFEQLPVATLPTMNGQPSSSPFAIASEIKDRLLSASIDENREGKGARQKESVNRRTEHTRCSDSDSNNDPSEYPISRSSPYQGLKFI